MSTNYVDTEAIDSQAEELKATVGAICSAAEEIASQCNSICGYASEYVQYNGYFDSDTKDTQYEEVMVGTEKTQKSYDVCQKFILTDGNITSKAQKLQQKANELSAAMVVLKQDSVLLKQVAAAIASNINSTNVALTSAYSRANGGSSLYIADEKFSILAYGALAMNGVQKANLARSAEDIKNRNFLNYSDVKDNGLSGKMLQFRAQPDGTYKVYTIDGEDTGYYTTFTAANNYQRTFKREMLKGDKNYLNTVFNGDEASISSAATQVATGSAAIAGISTTSKNTSQTKGAAAMAGAPTTGNRNIGNTNDSSSPLGETVTVKNYKVTSDNKLVEPGTYVKTGDGIYQKEAKTFSEKARWNAEYKSTKNNEMIRVTKDKYSTEDLENLSTLPIEVTDDSGSYIYNRDNNYYYKVIDSDDLANYNYSTINGKNVDVSNYYSIENILSKINK